MIKLNGGIKEAAKMLQGLTPTARLRVIEDMVKQNPELASEIQKQMFLFSDLQYLTEMMMRDLMKEIDVDKFALALRGCEKDLIDHILSLVSSNNKRDMKEILFGKPRALDEVQKAQEEILDLIRPKVESGEIVLNANDSETYV
jgi:flagellar motor switch protein FliG